MSIFDFFTNRKQKKQQKENLKNLAEKWAKEKNEKEGIIAENLIPTKSISLLLLNETDKVSSEPRVFEIDKDLKFDKFIPTIKTGTVNKHCDMKSLEPVEILYSVKINGYNLSNYNFSNWVDNLQLTTELVENNEEKYNMLKISNQNKLLFEERIPNSMINMVEDIKNGYVKVKDILYILNSIQQRYISDHEYNLKTNTVLSNKIKAEKFLHKIRAGKTSYDDLTTM